MFGWHQVARQQRREGISGGRRARAVCATGNVLRHGEERISESPARLVHAERNGKVARAFDRAVSPHNARGEVCPV